MLKRYTSNNTTWIDLFQPTPEEIREVMEEFDIHPSVANDLITPTFKPMVELHKNFVYLILHFPAFRHTHSYEENQEVDFVIGKDFLITSRYDTIDPIHKFSKEFEVNSILDKKEKNADTEHVFFLLVKKLYGSINHELEYIQDALEDVEKRIFQGEEKKMVKELSFLGRDLLNAKQATNPHKETLDSLEEVGAGLFGKNFNNQIHSIKNEYRRIRHKIEINKESLNELRETNNSLLSTKENETIKTLTIMAFVTFPLSLIASIFGMNTVNMPIIGAEKDFWIVIGIMLALATLFFIFFKYKKWL
ncbi:MAG: CorA family divalent cation transporter [Candidatus Pacebacteria bacterium]|nr:CorA family divalent cation transporter [Candidatus Paceibacterota bacterium]